MKIINEICIEKSTTIAEGVNILNSADAKLLLVVDNHILIGVVSDGDIRRRFIAAGRSSDETVASIMTRNPIFVEGFDKQKAIGYMRDRLIDIVPVVNPRGEPIGVYTWEDLLEDAPAHIRKKIDVPIVIMAGGKGTRLKPYTNVLPKPLIPIGEETIIERIMKSFIKCGCKRFIISINYKKNLIKSYFDVADQPYDICFLEEEDYLGTCGSLSLLKNMNEVFIVTNCDILLDIDYADLIKKHKENENILTVVTCKKKLEIPYGVFELDEKGKIDRMIEKPEIEYNINTGVYVFEPRILENIPMNTPYQMDEMIQKLLDSDERVGAYSIADDKWSDMGQMDGMNAMIQTFTKRSI